MKIEIQKYSIPIKIISTILALASTATIFTSPATLMESVEAGENKLASLYNMLQVFFAESYGVIPLIIFFLVFILYLYVSDIRNTRMNSLTMLLSAFLTAFIIMGICFTYCNSLKPICYDYLQIIKFGIVFIGYFSLLYASITVTYLIIIKILYIKKPYTSPLAKLYEPGAKGLLKIWMLIFSAWLVYLIVFFPGVGNYDTTSQIASFLGYEDFFYQKLPFYIRDYDTKGFLSDHHPIFHTVLLGSFAKLGLWLGHIHIGIFIFICLQSLFMAFVFAYTIRFMASLGLSHHWIDFSLFIYCFLPVFPLYAVAAIKNSPFCSLFLLYLVLLAELIIDFEKKINSKVWLGAFTATSLLQMLVIKYGFHTVLLTSIPLVIYFRHYWKKLLPLCFIPLFFFHFIYSGLLLPAFHVATGDLKEMIGPLFQQTARYISVYGDEVTEEEKEVLSKVFAYDNIVDQYDPIISDPLKYRIYLYNSCTREDLNEYFKVWWQQFLKHPFIYIEATLNNMFGYIYPENKMWIGYYELEERLGETTNGDLTLVSPPELSAARNVARQLIELIACLPVIGLFFYGSIHIWICSIVFVFLIILRQWRYLLIFVPILAQLLICAASPDNANARYILPFIFVSLFTVSIGLKVAQEKADILTDISLEFH